MSTTPELAAALAALRNAGKRPAPQAEPADEQHEQSVENRTMMPRPGPCPNYGKPRGRRYIRVDVRPGAAPPT
jgi:hypothetical protein